ncbi:MAG: hypothetical protein ACI4NJ_09845 [Cellvibrio sp.]
MQTELSLRWQKVLAKLGQDLAKNSAEKDWDEMAKTDAKIAKALEELNKFSQLPDSVNEARNQLKAIHTQAFNECVNACEQSRIQLLQQLQYAEARTAYAQSEHYFK